MNVENAKNALREMLDVLTSAGIRAFLMHGTLLGCVREGSFIGHDNDIDLGVFIEEWSDEVLYNIQDAGFKITSKFGFPEQGLEYSFAKYGIKVDIFCVYYDNDTGTAYAGLWVPIDKSLILKKTHSMDRQLVKLQFSLFTVEPCIFLDISCLQPSNPIQMLIEEYGEDWRTPVKKWDWATSHRNRVVTTITHPMVKYTSQIYRPKELLSLKNTFDTKKRCYIVTLMSDPKRVSHVNNVLIPSLRDTFEVEIFPAVEGKVPGAIEKSLMAHQVDLDSAYEKRARSGQIACTLSHLSVWKKACEYELPTLVLEDDSIITAPKVFEKYLHDIYSAEFAYLYTHVDQVPKDRRARFVTVKEKEEDEIEIVKSFRQWGTVGYVVSKEAAKKLVSKFQRIYNHTDEQLADIILQGDIDSFTILPSLIDTVGQPDSRKPQTHQLPSNVWNSSVVKLDKTLLQSSPTTEVDINHLYQHVTLIIKTFQRPACCEKLLRSIRDFYPGIRVVVVDDGDIHPHIEYPQQVTYIRTEFDIGVSRGRNMALDQVKTKYFVTLDDDNIITTQTRLDKWFDILESNPDVHLVGGEEEHTLPYHGAWKMNGGVLEIHLDQSVGTSENGLRLFDITHQFFMARTDAIQKVRWDDELKMYDHSVFFKRCKDAGLRITYDGTVVCGHERVLSANYKKFRYREDALALAMKKLGAETTKTVAKKK